ncbi:unnamed protein product, partial [Cyprideis torosa]
MFDGQERLVANGEAPDGLYNGPYEGNPNGEAQGAYNEQHVNGPPDIGAQNGQFVNEPNGAYGGYHDQFGANYQKSAPGYPFQQSPYMPGAVTGFYVPPETALPEMWGLPFGFPMVQVPTTLGALPVFNPLIQPSLLIQPWIDFFSMWHWISSLNKFIICLCLASCSNCAIRVRSCRLSV